MAQSRCSRFRLMTYNIGGGRRDLASDPVAVLEVVRSISPDILVVQEATDHQDADGTWFSDSEQIARAGGFGQHYCFGPTLTMMEHIHVGKSIMVRGLFRDWQDWRQGNAVFCRWGFVRLSDTAQAGAPRNVPLYRPPRYEGNRDTDPRYALLARANRAPSFPFVVGVHLTTLVGERDPDKLPGRPEQAQSVRTAQTRRLLDLVREHLLQRGELVFLLGDLNATVDEPCIAALLEAEGGFVRLQPDSASLATHPKVADAIDHILIYPGHRLVEYRCWIADSAIAREASDHLPVVADVTVE